MLTVKEIEVIKLVNKGLKQTEISKKLGISQPAVSSFYNSSLKKIEDAKTVLKIAKELKIE